MMNSPFRFWSENQKCQKRQSPILHREIKNPPRSVEEEKETLFLHVLIGFSQLIWKPSSKASSACISILGFSCRSRDWSPGVMWCTMRWYVHPRPYSHIFHYKQNLRYQRDQRRALQKRPADLRRINQAVRKRWENTRLPIKKLAQAVSEVNGYGTIIFSRKTEKPGIR